MGNSSSNVLSLSSGWTNFSSSANILPYYPSAQQFTDFLYNLHALLNVPRVILDIIAQYCESPIHSVCTTATGQIIQLQCNKPVVLYHIFPATTLDSIISCITTNDERLILSTSGIAGDSRTGIGRVHGKLLLWDIHHNKVQYELSGHSINGPCSFIRFVSLLLLPNNMFAAICKCKLLHVFKLVPKPHLLHIFQLPQQIRPTYRRSYFNHKHYYMQLLPFNRIAVCITPFVRDNSAAPIITRSPSLNGNNNTNVHSIPNINHTALNNDILTIANGIGNQNDNIDSLLANSNSNQTDSPSTEDSKEDSSPPLSSSCNPVLYRRISKPSAVYTSFFCILDIFAETLIGEARTLTRDGFASDLVYIGGKLFSNWSDGSIKECWFNCIINNQYI
jgi:hypothetical protein